MYVFDISNGAMLTFNEKLASQTVSQVKETIDRTYGMRSVDLVLVMSGGGVLDPNIVINSYSTGTETNPLYLYNKNHEILTDPSLSISYHEDEEVNVNDAIVPMSTTYKTLVARTQMAQDLLEASKQLNKVIEEIIRDQHYQQQGWLAVVVYLEDIVREYQNNNKKLMENFPKYMADRDKYAGVLQELNEDIRVLDTMPVLPGLRKGCSKELSLLEWISAELKIQDLADRCARCVENYDENTVMSLCSELNKTVEIFHDENLKRIHNIGNRLSYLETMINPIKLILSDQMDIAKIFREDHDRLAGNKDWTVFVCKHQSHYEFIKSMQKNYINMQEIRKKVSLSKDNLSKIIRDKLRCVVEIEAKLSGINDKIVTCNNELTSCRKELKILWQVHLTPELYVESVAEVVRRKTFTDKFTRWVSRLSSEMRTMYEQESNKRTKFNDKLDGHFLGQLFTGFDDLLPVFPLGETPVFDDKLPQLESEDLIRVAKTNDCQDQVNIVDHFRVETM